MKRTLLLAAAGLAFVLALAAALGVAPAGLRPGEVFVQVVGLVALLQAFRIARARSGARRDPEPHEPERPLSTPTPGESVEDALSRFAPEWGGPRWHTTKLGTALHDAAATVLTRFDGESPDDAEDALREGRWTADPFAATLLGGPDVGPPPLGARLRATTSGRSTFRLGVARAVDELLDRAPVDADGVAVAEAADPARPPGVTGRQPVADGGDPADSDRWETGRWKGVGAVAFAAVGAGVLASQPGVLLAGVVGVGYAAFARSGTAPAAEVAVERSVADDRPSPGDDVEVTVTVHNEGDATVPDLRVVDGVPPALAVVEGSPRHGTTLRPGETATYTYEVAARRGVHEFDPVRVLARDLAGTHCRERLVAAAGSLTCVPTPRPVATAALRRGLTGYAGRHATDEGGAGVEFHATREYRPGDSRNRVDWKRWARTGDLSTVEFRSERAARVVLLVDARDRAYCAPGPGSVHAVDRAVDAAGRLFAGLLDGGDRVGLAAFAPSDPWLAPGAGADHRARARRLLGTHEAFSPVPPDEPTNLWRAGRRLRRRLDAGTGVVVLSPLVDDSPARTARTLAAAGHPVTVVSPDPTGARTPAQRISRVVRAIRLSELREAGVRVLDWRHDERLDAALARADGRWST